MVDHFTAEFQRQHCSDLSKNKRSLHRLRTACEYAKVNESDRIVCSNEKTTIIFTFSLLYHHRIKHRFTSIHCTKGLIIIQD